MNTITSKQISLESGAYAHPRPADAAGAAPGNLRLAMIWTILRFTFGLVPIVAGLDKFTNLLTHWEAYLNPAIVNVLPLSGQTIMGIVGVIEIAAGILVLARPRLGALIVTAWLTGIAVSLIASGTYLDVAVRDLVMAIGVFAFAKLTPLVEREKAAESAR